MTARRDADQDRESREARALRQNLRRRKAQQRARETPEREAPTDREAESKDDTGEV